jgi:hypothetical protein
VANLEPPHCTKTAAAIYDIKTSCRTMEQVRKE